MKHAEVIRDGFKVPLIGIPMSSTLERCDLCGEEHPLREIELSCWQFLCAKCSMEKKFC